MRAWFALPLSFVLLAGCGGGSASIPATGSAAAPNVGPGAGSGSGGGSGGSGGAGSGGAGSGTATNARWIGAWGAPLNTQQNNGSPQPSNATVRNVARVSLGGTALRIRLSNALGSSPLVIGAATVALQAAVPGPGAVAGSTRAVTFGGNKGITIAPGTDVVTSDAVTFPVSAQQNVVVSLYLSGSSEPIAPTAVWNSNFVTANGAGDRTGDESGASFTANLAGPTYRPGAYDVGGVGYALTGIDVLTTQANGAVVAFGSSTFQGDNSDQDGYDRVTDLLAARIDNEIAAGKQKGLVNAGVGADSLYQGLARLNRDAFSVTGVDALIVYDINDIGLGGRTLAQIEGDYQTVVSQSHQRGIRVYCPTWAPEAQDVRGEVTQEREQLNAWLLSSKTCDGVVDWDAVLRNSLVPVTYNPAYFTDGIHANAAGHKAMANAVDVGGWFGF